MKTTQIEVTGEVELSYDENSREFKEALEAYKKCMDPNGSKDDMLKHVAFYITRFGEVLVEGVGYVGFDGEKPHEEPFSGIMVGDGYDEFNFEIK